MFIHLCIGIKKSYLFDIEPGIISHRLCFKKTTHFLPSKSAWQNLANKQPQETKAKVQCLLLCFPSSSLAMCRFNDFHTQKHTEK